MFVKTYHNQINQFYCISCIHDFQYDIVTESFPFIFVI